MALSRRAAGRRLGGRGASTPSEHVFLHHICASLPFCAPLPAEARTSVCFFFCALSPLRSGGRRVACCRWRRRVALYLPHMRINVAALERAVSARVPALHCAAALFSRTAYAALSAISLAPALSRSPLGCPLTIYLTPLPACACACTTAARRSAPAGIAFGHFCARDGSGWGVACGWCHNAPLPLRATYCCRTFSSYLAGARLHISICVLARLRAPACASARIHRFGLAYVPAYSPRQSGIRTGGS